MTCSKPRHYVKSRSMIALRYKLTCEVVLLTAKLEISDLERPRIWHTVNESIALYRARVAGTFQLRQAKQAAARVLFTY